MQIELERAFAPAQTLNTSDLSQREIERYPEDMEYTKLNVNDQVPFPLHSYIFHIPPSIYLFCLFLFLGKG